MAVTKTLLKASSSRPGTVGDMLATVNDELCEQTDTRHVRLPRLWPARSAHRRARDRRSPAIPSPFLLGADGDCHAHERLPRRRPRRRARRSATASPTLSSRPATRSSSTPTASPRRSTSADQFYSPARLQIVLRELAAAPVEKITRGVVQDVRAFAAEREQSDDISVMAVRWLGPAAAPTPT